MDTYTVSFFGHRHIDNPLAIDAALDVIIGALLQNKAYVEFLVGRNGEFDQLASSAIRRCKREIRDNNSAHVWVLPYMTADFRDFEDDYRAYYDEIEVHSTGGGHYKAAFQARNRNMVDRSDLIVFFVERKEGGAYQTMRYATQQGKHYINLADSLEEYK
ncbi:MAG: hypothetical protein IKW46_02855 [Bacteroidaceae bacterium]|nr:hypothetical protein [Bacteroidaceae bacterium]